MHFKANKIRLQFNEDGHTEVVLTSTERQLDISRLREAAQQDKLLNVEIKQHRPRRSLDANAYLWVMLDKLADAINTDKWQVYLDMLARYGVFTHLIVKPQVVDRVKEEWRAVRELGEVTVKGKTGVQLQCYFGSSGYNSKEMSRLIDGVVSECKELGVDVLPPEEIESLKNHWRAKDEITSA